MKKALFITVVTIGFSAVPVFAASPKANEHAQTHSQAQVNIVVSPTPTSELTVSPTVTLTVTPTATSTPTPTQKQDKDIDNSAHAEAVPTPSTTCDPSADYKNHGEYVSCVAHLHLGGQVVSAAARSDVGKNHAEVSPTPTTTVSPTPTQPVSSPVSSAEAAMHTFNPLDALGSLFNRFFGFFKHLI